MKSAKKQPTERDETIIVVKSDEQFEIRIWNRLLGDAVIGQRLGRKDGIPSLPTKATTWSSAWDLQKRWQAWLDATPRASGRGKRR